MTTRWSRLECGRSKATRAMKWASGRAMRIGTNGLLCSSTSATSPTACWIEARGLRFTPSMPGLPGSRVIRCGSRARHKDSTHNHRTFQGETYEDENDRIARCVGRRIGRGIGVAVRHCVSAPDLPLESEYCAEPRL